ncbi:MAG: TonB-dependent receptor [Cytophagales bacterium]|nr:TonB-dependent receptor [Cytophagales bacterium]
MLPKIAEIYQFYKLIYRIAILLIISLTLSTYSFAQNFDINNVPAIGAISGTVTDAATDKPVEYATVSVVHKRDSTLMAGVLTDEKGHFKIEQLKPGRYTMKITFLGYNTKILDSVMVSFKNPNTHMGKIKLGETKTALNEVEVTGERKVMEMAIDKKIFNVEKNIMATGGTAADVMNQVPSVTFDMDGNLNLRGSSSVQIWINGRQSNLTGSSKQDILNQIPASIIDKIEIITNPSSKFDSEGQAGIINIILKKSNKIGLNGGMTVGIGTRNKYNASANVSIRSPKSVFNFGYATRYQQNWGRGINYRTNTGTNLKITDNDNTSERYNQNHSLSSAYDYNINTRNVIGVNAMLNFSQNTHPEDIHYKFADRNLVFFNEYNRHLNQRGQGINTDIGLNYKKTFANPGQELTALTSISLSDGKDSSRFISTRTDNIRTLLYPSFSTQNNNSFNINRVITSQVDYIMPVKDIIKIETGIKNTNRNLDNKLAADSMNIITSSIVANTNLSNQFIFSDNVLGAYIQASKKIGSIGVQAGLRGEHTYIDMTQVKTNEKFSRDYFNLFPSIFLSKKLKYDFEVMLNYTRRINRPGGEQLNPVVVYSDPYNIRKGNPSINPEYVDSYELSLTKETSKHTFTANTYYRKNNNQMQRFRTVDTTGVAVTSFINLGYGWTSGLELTTRHEIYKWWSVMPNLNVFVNELFGQNDTYLNGNVSWFGRIMTNLKIVNTEIQISFNYNGPFIMPQGKVQAIPSMDIGVKRDLVRNKLSATLNLSDVFDTRQFQVEMIGSNFNGTMMRKRESRVLNFTLSYKFGKEDMAFRRQQRRRDGGGEGAPQDMGGF